MGPKSKRAKLVKYVSRYVWLVVFLLILGFLKFYKRHQPLFQTLITVQTESDLK